MNVSFHACSLFFLIIHFFRFIHEDRYHVLSGHQFFFFFSLSIRALIIFVFHFIHAFSLSLSVPLLFSFYVLYSQLIHACALIVVQLSSSKHFLFVFPFMSSNPNLFMFALNLFYSCILSTWSFSFMSHHLYDFMLLSPLRFWRH